jgi:hypothetical protein
MKKVRYSEFLKKRELEDVLIEKAIADVEELEAYLEKSSVSLDDCSAEDLKLFIGLLIKDKKNSLERLVNLARYFYVVQRIDLYRYFLGILGGDGVINSIARRTTQFTDAETKEHIFSGIVFPPLGSPIEDYPIVMQKFVKRMQALLPNGLLKKILAGNHHDISHERFRKEKEILGQFHGDLDAYLVDYHQRRVSEIEHYCKEGKIWYEQIITPQTVDYVRNNPEILGGVRKEDRVYITRIPYEPQNYFDAVDPDLKRYYTCSCPFVRTSLLSNEHAVIPEWCYCSGGFVKQLFDVLFDRDLPIEVLETPFKGDLRCRFAIDIGSQ